MNPKAKGELTEGIILSTLLKRGLVVAIPFGNNQRYDLIIDDGSKLIKAQCKTGRLISGAVQFNVSSTSGGKRTGYKNQADIFLVYCPQTDTVYKIPVGICGNSAFSIRVTDTKPNAPRSLINWAKDFIF